MILMNIIYPTRTRADSMEVLLRRFNDPSQSPVDLFADLVTQLRPVRYNDGDSVTLAIHALCHLLANHADLRVGFRRNFTGAAQPARARSPVRVRRHIAQHRFLF